MERCRPRNLEYVTIREKLFIIAQNFYDGRVTIIKAFKDKTVPLNTEEGFFEDVHRGDEDKDEDKDEDENNLDDLDRAVL